VERVIVTETFDVPVNDLSSTGEARRIVREFAGELGFGETAAERAAIVATELSTNLLKHGGGGRILVSNGSSDPGWTDLLSIIAVDKGRGMSDPTECFRDGFTTSTSPGTGLGAVARLSQEVDVYSLPGQGTVVLARISRERRHLSTPPRNRSLHAAAVRVRKPGQEVCGDDWGITQNGPRFTIVMADGLGHGPEAARASGEAIRIARKYVTYGPKDVLEAIHAGVRSTRGAAVGVAQVDVDRETVSFSGAGNVAAAVVSDSKPAQHLVSVNGTAGHEVRRLQEYAYPWPAGGVLIMHSDGLGSRWAMGAYPGLLERDPALIAAVLYRDFTRQNDDTTVLASRIVGM
jgi:anti-sigma regulatory factor (Ser/Thr protein kinase)